MCNHRTGGDDDHVDNHVVECRLEGYQHIGIDRHQDKAIVYLSDTDLIFIACHDKMDSAEYEHRHQKT